MRSTSLLVIGIALLLTTCHHSHAAASSPFTCPNTQLEFPPVLFRGGAKSSPEGPRGPLGAFLTTLKSTKKHLASAAFARCVSIFAMYPVDSIKTRMQMGQANPLRLNGIFGGVGGSLIGQVPYGALTFGSYEVYKAALVDRFSNVKPIFLYAAAAVMGDLTGSVWICPSEVVKQKVQAGIFKGTGEAITSIWKQAGPIGFYEGYLGGIARDVPFRVAQLTTYEVAKDVYLKLKKRRLQVKEANLTPLESAMVGAFAGTVAATVTAPLDRFKTLLMTNSGQYGGTLVSCAAKVWRDEGMRGLTRGIVPRLGYITPSVAIFFVAYEAAQQRLKNWD